MKATIISKNSPRASKKSQNEWAIIHLKVRFKYKGEKFIIQLNAEEIELILKWAYCVANGADNRKWTLQVEMILDEALAEIYSRSPTQIIKQKTPATEKEPEAEISDKVYRFVD